jgi:hypothetical protein
MTNVKADADTAKDSTPRTEGDALNVQDVLSGIVPEGAEAGMLGAYLTFETVGNSTVVRVDTGGAGPEAPLQIVTLEGVTGVTLQQLLNNDHIMT